MCAQFHPTEDMVVSASLDQTIRVWDISGIKRKRSSASSSHVDDRLSPRVGQIELFSQPDGFCKFTLEGHDRGVNWVQFHPNKPLIVSGSDDRSIKIWRYNDSRGWETDTLRGHSNNVSCVIFHPRLDVILSNGEDKTLRIWDYSKKGSVPVVHRREHDRFWVLVCHPSLNIVGAGHDSGFLIFKTEHERPAFSLFQNQLFLLRDRSLVTIDLSQGFKEVLLGNLDSKTVLPAILGFSTSDNSIVLSSNFSSSYSLFNLKNDLDRKTGSGNFGTFVGRNRFAVLSAVEQKVYIKASDNTNVKGLSCPVDAKIDRLFPSPPGSVLMGNGELMYLVDVQSESILGKFSVKGAKYAVWNADFTKAVLFGKTSIYIFNKHNLVLEHSVHDLSTVKSAVWDPCGIIFYTNSSHFKYILPNGDTGLICTVKYPVYLVRVVEDTVYVVDRQGLVHSFQIDPTEYMFKLALLQNDYGRINQMIENSNLMGQSIISYLRKNGYSHLALGFVRDSSTRFELGVESGDLESALDAACEIDKKEVWNRLADGAMALGNFIIAEKCLLKTDDRSRLSFLYLITGNFEKMKTLNEEVPKNRADLVLQNNLLLGDAAGLASSLSNLNLPSLAFMAAKNAGLEAEAKTILSDSGSNPGIAAGLPTFTPLLGCKPVFTQTQSWPMSNVKAAPKKANKILKTATAALASTTMSTAEGNIGLDLNDLEIEDAGWEFADVDDNLNDIAIGEDGLGLEDATLPAPGQAPLSSISSSMKLDAFSLAACGDIDGCLRFLNEKYSVVNFKPLEPLILCAAQGCSLPFEQFDGSVTWTIRMGEEKKPKSFISVAHCSSDFEAAMQLMTAGKFADVQRSLENVLALSLFVSEDEDNSYDLIRLRLKCRDYLLGIKLEIKKREILASDPRLALSLACSFARLPLRPDHSTLALRSALSLSYKLECFSMAGKIAARLLELNPPESTVSQVIYCLFSQQLSYSCVM